MVHMAAESGTTDLVCTPHANLTYRFEPERVSDRIAEVSSAADSAVHLHFGCDFHLSYENIHDALENPRKYTIGHKNYLLVEFSDLMIFRNTPEILGRLQETGLIPVVTHPERNPLLRQRIDEMEAWVEAGARVQVTAQSLLGDFGRRAKECAETLLDSRLVHFVASDAHSCERRPPRLDLAYAWLKEKHGEALAEALCVANPRAVLQGETLETDSREVAAVSRKWYQLWRS